LHRIERCEVTHHLHLTGLLQRFADIVALAIHRWIDLGRNFAVALIFLESDVVCSGSRP